MKLLFQLYIAFLLPQLVIAQFWETKNAGFANDSMAVWNICIVDENTVWASGFNIYEGSQTYSHQFTKSTNGGESFEPNEFSGLPDSLHISYLHAATADSAWLAMWGDSIAGSSIFFTSNGGASWHAQSTADFSGANAFANIVYFFDSKNGVCMGDPNNGYFEHYTTTDGGQNWVRVNSVDLPVPLSGEAGYNRGKSFDVVDGIIYYGTNKGRILKSSDMGYTWTAYDTDLDIITKIAFKDSLTGIIVGEGIQSLITFTGGISWYYMAFNTEYYGGQIEYAHGNDGFWATIWQGAGISGSAYSLNNGSSWTRMDSVFYTDIQFVNTDIGWAGGISGISGNGGMFKWIGVVENDVTINKIQSANIFPNPCTTNICISNAVNCQLKIYSNLGNIVFSERILEDFQNFELNSLEAGLYFVEIVNLRQKIITKHKLLKMDY
ncbi:MAG: T9SS type A sorting domain-containing protein [Bacteroidales bacterium]|nr:T9SS type A sorting domain-containing protein [Bacteroidales bacterium]